MICIKFFGDQPSMMNPLDVESQMWEKKHELCWSLFQGENILIHVTFIKIWENHIFISLWYHVFSIYISFWYHFPRHTMGFPRLHHGCHLPPLCVSRILRSRQEENRPVLGEGNEGNDSENLGQPRFQAPNDSFTAKKSLDYYILLLLVYGDIYIYMICNCGLQY